MLLTAVVTLLTCTPALAYTLPPDPGQNMPYGNLPDVCFNYAKGPVCENAVIYYLDQARQTMGLSPYALPADFTSLAPEEQLFILTDLDRVAYGITPITGLTAALDNDAATSPGADPSPSDPNFTSWASSFDGGGPNAETAYNDWVYNDGLGSANADCTPSDPGGCWGHRHVVFWDVDNSAGPSAMGAAQIGDVHRMIVGAGNASYAPTYSYTWAQAQADGAGTNVYVAPATVGIAMNVTGTGTVSSAVDGEHGGFCEGPGDTDCVLSVPENEPVTLTEAPGPYLSEDGGGFKFAGWSGACSGDSPTCTISPGQPTTTVGATFVTAQRSEPGPGGSAPSTHRPRILRVTTGRGTIHATLRGSHLRCALAQHRGRRWRTLRSIRCGRSVTFRRLAAGRYRLTVASGTSSISRIVGLRRGWPAQRPTRRRKPGKRGR